MPTTNMQNAGVQPKPTKVIVAVHGIGDQFQFATIQSVANRFSAFSTTPQALPLGKFYDQPIGTPPEIAYLLQMELDRIDKQRFGFVEVYWADIPRIPEKEGYTVEESKKWGKTVIDRLRPYSQNDPKTLTPRDLEMAKGLLEEMLDTLTVLERLVFLADKAGLFKLNLQEILINYLGDVQLVTDFKNYRDKILHRFFEVMNYIARFAPDAEIYIVAHSEGTVVAFLSLLEAIACTLDPNHKIPEDIGEGRGHVPPLDSKWLKQVKGLMTIGSPIDKHLIFWPDLWVKFETLPKSDESKKLLPSHKILWRNYYDYGDPIGFELDTARRWLCENGLQRVFEFPKSHDHGFGRYPFPGKAHNDYWDDSEVFDHFIETVVKAAPPSANTPTEMCNEAEELKELSGKKAKTRSERPADEPAPPSNKILKSFLSNTAPYCLVFGFICLGVYFVHKAVNEYEEVDERTIGILRNVVGMSCLLAGLTGAAQLPRLTRHWKWRFAAFALFVLSAVGYRFITTIEVRDRLGCFLAYRFPFIPSPTWAVVALASVIAIAVYLIGQRWSRGGLRILLGLSVVGLILTVGVSLRPDSLCALPLPLSDPGCHKKSLWPLFLATAGFLYLWWLAGLTFDLVIVWHYYIRRSVAMKRLRSLRQTGRLQSL